MKNSSTPYFETDELGIDYAGDFTLDVPDLRIGRGEAVAIVGPSGAGKTTLLNALGAALRPRRGTVRIEGRDIRSLEAGRLRSIRTDIGFVPQDFALVPNVRVLRNVLAGRLGQKSFAASLRSQLLCSRKELREVHEILDTVGIGEKLYHRTDTLSGGQRQRVAIARALYQDPHALIADEPISSVDPARARDTLQLLLELSRRRRLTLVISTHSIELARELFPRLVGLRAGKIEFDGAANDVTEHDIENLYRLTAAEKLRDGA